MQSSMKRVLKSRQIGLVQTYHLISGTAGTPADSGADAMYVDSVVDNGTGDYTITFKGKSLRDIEISGLVSVTPGIVLNVDAIDEESVTVTAFSSADGTTATDADFYMSCIHATTVEAKF